MSPANRPLRRYLEEGFTDEAVRDPLWQHIYLAPGFREIIASQPFLKLDRIKQLGPTHMVYPGATHTRLSHSLGVYHLAQRLLKALLRCPDCPPLSLEGGKAFLCAALLHDLGHFPFAHSLKELPLKEHETLTGEIMQTPPLASLIRERVGADPAVAAAIVDETREIRLSAPKDASAEQDSSSKGAEILFFRSLLSGVLDPDKLDYLNRDAYFCGIPYGLQDLDFVISQVRPHPKCGLAVTEKGLSAVENILFSKFLMYKSVYWHRRVRTATAAMKKGVFRALDDGLFRPEDLYGLDDHTFLELFSEKSPALPSNHPSRTIVGRATQPGAWDTLADWPLEGSSPAEEQLFALESRSLKEREIAQMLTRETNTDFAPEEIILDVSPSISFEVDLPVLTKGGWQNFTEAGTVFRRPVVEGFTANLRRLALILPREKKQAARPALPRLKEILP